MSQNSTVPSSCRVAGISGVRGMADDALGGVGGAAGRKNDGIAATEDYMTKGRHGQFQVFTCFSGMRQLTMTEMYRTIFGMSEGFDAHSESINCPNAAPNGFAKLATAVALVLPLSENQRSLYRVGAHRQNGCASPIKI